MGINLLNLKINLCFWAYIFKKKTTNSYRHTDFTDRVCLNRSIEYQPYQHLHSKLNDIEINVSYIFHDSNRLVHGYGNLFHHICIYLLDTIRYFLYNNREGHTAHSSSGDIIYLLVQRCSWHYCNKSLPYVILC